MAAVNSTQPVKEEALDINTVYMQNPQSCPQTLHLDKSHRTQRGITSRVNSQKLEKPTVPWVKIVPKDLDIVFATMSDEAKARTRVENIMAEAAPKPEIKRD